MNSVQISHTMIGEPYQFVIKIIHILLTIRVPILAFAQIWEGQEICCMKSKDSQDIKYVMITEEKPVNSLAMKRWFNYIDSATFWLICDHLLWSVQASKESVYF